MTKLVLAAGVAALAIAAPATAERGGHGGGNKAHAAKADRGGGGKAHAARSDRGGKAHAAKADRRSGQRFAAVSKGRAKAERHVDKVAKFDRRDVVRVRDIRGEDRFDRRIGSRGWADGCPPGLWKKHNGCMPPGLAKNRDLVGRMIPSAYRRGVVPLGLRDLYRDSDDYYYRYGDGYMYRVDRRTNLIASLLPLLGGGYAPGQLFPTNYMNSYIPNSYQSFYPDTADAYYRYANGNVYRIDPYSGMIDDVIPMYGYGYGYGQMLPSSYSYYNVPDQYRSMYYDTPDHYYRYAPGAIYQVDRNSSLITAVASLLAGDLGVGSRLPLGYDAYNVPLAYRTSYYDTPTAWYRYNDGYIYRVDPKTRLVTAVIDALV